MDISLQFSLYTVHRRIFEEAVDCHMVPYMILTTREINMGSWFSQYPGFLSLYSSSLSYNESVRPWKRKVSCVCLWAWRNVIFLKSNYRIPTCLLHCAYKHDTSPLSLTTHYKLVIITLPYDIVSSTIPLSLKTLQRNCLRTRIHQITLGVLLPLNESHFIFSLWAAVSNNCICGHSTYFLWLKLILSYTCRIDNFGTVWDNHHD